MQFSMNTTSDLFDRGNYGRNKDEIVKIRWIFKEFDLILIEFF